MKLYYSPGACSLASRIAFNELGLEAQYERVDLKTKLTETGRDFREVNPLGYVPVLELDDGTFVTENSAILPFIADIRPGSLAPAPDSFERVQLNQVLGFLSGELHKSYSPFFGGVEGAEREKATQKLESRLAHLDRLIGDSQHLIGNQLTVADIYAFVILNWSANIGVSLDKWPAVSAFVREMASRKSVASALQQEGLTEAAS